MRSRNNDHPKKIVYSTHNSKATSNSMPQDHQVRFSRVATYYCDFQLSKSWSPFMCEQILEALHDWSTYKQFDVLSSFVRTWPYADDIRENQRFTNSDLLFLQSFDSNFEIRCDLFGFLFHQLFLPHLCCCRNKPFLKETPHASSRNLPRPYQS